MNKLENKHLLFPLEIKSFSSNGYFAGYASIFNYVDNQRDIVAEGAFKETIKNRASEIKLLWQHKTDEPIGFFTSIKEDKFGLYVEGKLLLEVAKASEAYELMKEGVLDGLSIGYTVKKSYLDEKSGVRVLTKIDLFEISLVTFPANENARVTSVKQDSLKEVPETVRQFEEFLRDAGFSRKEAKAITSQGFRQRDADESFFELGSALERGIKALS